MRILILDDHVSDGVPLAWKFQMEGHEVWLHSKEKGQTPEGMARIPLSYQPDGAIITGSKLIKDFDLVVATGREFADAAPVWRKKGIPYIGPDKQASRLEIERDHGLRVLENAGVLTPPWKGFRDLGEGERFAKGYGKALVFKPNGVKAPSYMTMVSKNDDNADLIAFMRKCFTVDKELSTAGYILQEKVSGIEMAAGAYFDGIKFVQPIQLNWENKGYAPPPWTGPSTGEMGTHALCQWSPKLFTEVTEKMTPHLQSIGYRGFFDVNCILTKDGPMALEHTPRLGFPMVCLSMTACRTSFASFLVGVGSSKQAMMNVIDPWVVGVLMTTMPHPYEELVKHPEAFSDLPVDGEFSRHLYPVDVKKKGGRYFTGVTGYVAVACGVGPSLQEAKEDAYMRARKINCPYLYCRQDISDRFQKDREELQKRGYV